MNILDVILGLLGINAGDLIQILIDLILSLVGNGLGV